MPVDKEKSVILIGFLPNPRIYKRIELEKEIFDVTLICWDRGCNMLFPPSEDGYHTDVIKIKAANDPIRRMIPYERFSFKAKQLLEEIHPKLIHVQGLDMLRIAMAYKKGHSDSVKIIYEVADLHRLLVDKQHNPIRKLAQYYLKHQDKVLCRKIDLLIVTSEQYINRYFSDLVPSEKIMVFPNVPNLNAFSNYNKRKHTRPLTIGFIGEIRYKKQIKNLLIAAQQCGMRVLLAGFENGDNEIEKLSEKMENVEWIGRFDYNSQVAELYSKCDIIYSVYDADMANVRVALPNKLYESIYCGLPIIVAKSTYLAELVEKWGVGIAVDYQGPEELEKVLQSFQDNSGLFDKYEKNCEKHKDVCNLNHYNRQLKDIISKWI